MRMIYKVHFQQDLRLKTTLSNLAAEDLYIEIFLDKKNFSLL